MQEKFLHVFPSINSTEISALIYVQIVVLFRKVSHTCVWVSELFEHLSGTIGSTVQEKPLNMGINVFIVCSIAISFTLAF